VFVVAMLAGSAAFEMLERVRAGRSAGTVSAAK